MGKCKQLLPLGNCPVIVRCLAGIFCAGIDDVIVVVGSRHEQVVEAISAFPVKLVRNREPESEMADSIRVGMAALPGSATGAIVALADHPLVVPETYRSLLRAHGREPGKIVVPVHGERRGHPTLFPLGVLQELRAQGNLRDLVSRLPGRVLFQEVPDAGILADMDTPEDYRRIAAGIGGAAG